MNETVESMYKYRQKKTLEYEKREKLKNWVKCNPSVLNASTLELCEIYT